jgi:hypothetical protein
VGTRESGYGRGVILHTTDNATWQEIASPHATDHVLMETCFTSNSHGWAVGTEYNKKESRGVILEYLNGTWKDVQLPSINDPNWELNSVSCSEKYGVWAVGTFGDTERNSTKRKGLILRYK